MPPQLDLFCIGFAAVIDTVLLLVVLERVNRPLTAIWLKWALAGVTLWHIGSFLHETLRETIGPMATWLDALCMITMATGLLLLTCGVLHAGLRIDRTGAIAHPPADWRYIAIYVPAMFVVIVSASIIRSGSRDFLEATRGYHIPYLAWLTFSNLTTAWLLFRNRDQNSQTSVLSGRFLIRFSLGLIAVTALTLIYVILAQDSPFEPQLRLTTTLSPLIPTLVFAYYIFRRRLLPLVFERTLVYGAILLAVFYLHRLTLTPLMSKYSRELQFDFVVIEGLLLVALILAYQPLRDRFREGLRYLIGGDVSKVRDATRQLSVELSRRGAEDVEHICQWFADGLANALNLRYAWLTLRMNADSYRVLHVSREESSSAIAGLLTEENIRKTSAAFCNSSQNWTDRSRCENSEQLALMRDLDLIAAFPIQYHDIQGLLLLGAVTSGDRLPDEQLNTISLLVDQYAATIHNRQLEEARQTAERRAVQQEKLSTLGLLSGSLAHELKNPLSSMRTVATLLKEDLADSENSKDAELIISEIDRLTQTTQRLLDFSRPADSTTTGVAPDRVIERLLHILTHLARQHGVTITTDLQLRDKQVNTTDASLSEILFNLIKNAIEAVRDIQQPAVEIHTSQDNEMHTSQDSEIHTSQDSETISSGLARISIRDNGPGISAELQNQIFEPFVTGKTDGTGLGLYLVAERVREVNGQITCTSQSTGTAFEVMLPIHADKPD